MAPSFFIFGLSGYIGGAVLVAIREHFGPSTVIGGLVRSQKNVPLVEAFGVKVYLGGHSDLDLIEKALGETKYDFIINTADADDQRLVNTILKVVKDQGGAAGGPAFIQTSGAALVVDQPSGYLSPWAEKVWDDNKVEDIASIDVNAIHRKVDLTIFEAIKSGEANAYILAPPMIYGVAYKNPVNRNSMTVPALIRFYKQKGQALHAGDGSNVCDNVHIDDLSQLYVLLIERVLSHPAAPASPFENFYWGATTWHKWIDVFNGLAKILYAKGLIRSPQSEGRALNDLGLAPEDLAVYFTAINERVVANRSFSIGWKPKAKSIIDTLNEDVEAALAAK